MPSEHRHDRPSVTVNRWSYSMKIWWLVAGLLLVSSWSGCSTPSVVIPDSKEIRPAYTAKGEDDPERVTLDLGYLREILMELDRCHR